MSQMLGAQATFLHLDIRGNQLLLADYNLENGYLRSVLELNEIHSIQYIQRNFSTLYDLIDDLISLGNHTFIFYVEENGYEVSKLVAKELKNSDDSYRIIWHGPVASYRTEQALLEADVDVCLLMNEEQALLQLLKPDSANEGVPGTAWKSEEDEVVCEEAELEHSLDAYPSPYRSQVIPSENAPQLGLRMMQTVRDQSGTKQQRFHLVERLLDDLDHLQTAAPNSLIPLHADDWFSNPEFGQALAANLIARKYRLFFQSTFTQDVLTPAVLQTLYQANVRGFRIKVTNPSALLATPAWAQLVKQLTTEAGARFQFVICNDESMQAETIGQLAQVILANGLTAADGLQLEAANTAGHEPYPVELATVISRYSGSQNSIYTLPEHEQALVNGLIAFNTGMYPYDSLNNSVKHLGIAKDVLNDEVMFELRGHMGLNSSIMIRTESGEAEQPNLYRQADHVPRMRNDVFNAMKQQADESGFYLSHLLQLQERKDQPAFDLQIDDIYRETPLSVGYSTYGEATGTGDGEGLQFLRIESAKDLDQFLADVDHFIKYGKIRNAYEMDHLVTDSCRWSGAGACRLNQLPRFQTDDELNVLPCGGCSTSIGTLQDSYFDLVQQTFVLSEEEQLNRGCATCEVKDHCSKCTLVPDFMEPDQYCAVRKKQPHMHLYFTSLYLLNALRNSSNLLKGVPIENVKLSNRIVSHYLTRDTQHDTAAEYVVPNVYMYVVHDQAVLFNSATRRILKLNEPLAVIFEALLRGWELHHLEAFLCDRFSISAEQAGQVVKQAIENFKNAGCVKNEVLA